MKLQVIGCSGRFPGPESPAPCYVVSAEHEGRTWRVALDFGNGALGAMQRHLDPRDLDAVVLTHLHHPAHVVLLARQLLERASGVLQTAKVTEHRGARN